MKYLTERERLKDTLLKEGDYTSTKEMFERVAKLMPDKKIIGELDENKNIVYHTALDILDDIEAIGDGLIGRGLEGKHIVISADNSYRYLITDLAIAGGVGVVTPIDKDAPNDLFTTLINRCDADVIICSHHIIKKVEQIKDGCPKLKTIITIDKKVDGYPCLTEIMEEGKNRPPYYRDKKLDLAAPAKLLFTSGTTGPNKGYYMCSDTWFDRFVYQAVVNKKYLSAKQIKCLEKEVKHLKPWDPMGTLAD